MYTYEYDEQKTANQEKQSFEETQQWVEQEEQKWYSQPRSMQKNPIVIPAIARGHEDIYERFLKGTLIYKPNTENDIGRIEMPIASLSNPLESTFDLSQCGDADKHLIISTGYRKGKIERNSFKSEVWIVPKFVIENKLDGTTGHYKDIISHWTAPFGVFFTWGGWDELDWYDYLVTSTPEKISSKNLYENWRDAITTTISYQALLRPQIPAFGEHHHASPHKQSGTFMFFFNFN